MSSKADFTRVNVEESSNPTLQKYGAGITKIPTIVWADSSGNVLKQTGMPGDEETFVNAINNISRGR